MIFANHNAAAKRRRQGFSVTELIIASAVMVLVMLMLIYTMLFGMRLDQLSNSKLGASDQSRMSFDYMTTDIRAAKMWSIGDYSPTKFTPCGNAKKQLGNALRVWFSLLDTNAYTTYYFDTNDFKLLRLTNGVTTSEMIAQNLTNTMQFHAEDYKGSNADELTYKNVIVATMEFKQYQYPLTLIGPDYFYNYYRIQFRIASHNAD